MKNLFCILVAVLGLLSCTSDYDNALINEFDQSIINHEHHITMAQAKDQLSQIISDRAFSYLSLQPQFEIIGGGFAYDENGNLLTRSEEDDALYYVFNIGHNGAYAIMGASTRLPELIAFSEGDDNNGVSSSNSCNYTNYISSLKDSLDISSLDFSFDPVIADTLETFYLTNKTECSLLNDVEPLDLKWKADGPFNLPLTYTGPPNFNWGEPCCATCLYLIHPKVRPQMEKQVDYMFYSEYDTCRYFDWDLMSTIKSREDCEINSNWLALRQVASLMDKI